MSQDENIVLEADELGTESPSSHDKNLDLFTTSKVLLGSVPKPTDPVQLGIGLSGSPASESQDQLGMGSPSSQGENLDDFTKSEDTPKLLPTKTVPTIIEPVMLGMGHNEAQPSKPSASTVLRTKEQAKGEQFPQTCVILSQMLLFY